jgi:hypothetical protein
MRLASIFEPKAFSLILLLQQPNMNTAATLRRQQLAEQVLRIEREELLDRISELVVQAEMEARTEESLAELERGEFLTVEEFERSNREWLRKRGIGS